MTYWYNVIEMFLRKENLFENEIRNFTRAFITLRSEIYL